MAIATTRAVPRARARATRALPGKALFYVCITVFLLVTFAPIYWIILSAFTPITELFTQPLRYIPAHPSLINFRTVADLVPLGQQFFNSAFLATLSAALSVVVSLMAGYAFARIRFPGSSLFFLGMLLSGFLPTIATIIPLFQIFQSLSLVDSLHGLLILLVNLLLPTSVWLMTSSCARSPWRWKRRRRSTAPASRSSYGALSSRCCVRPWPRCS